MRTGLQQTRSQQTRSTPFFWTTVSSPQSILRVPAARSLRPRASTITARSWATISKADGITAHGFLRDEKGVFTTIDHPDAPLGTVALDINNRGQIVGAYVDAELATHGFLLDRGVFTTIDPPGASFTEAAGINGRGQIVGPYLDPDGTAHGFLRDRGHGARRDTGVFTTIDLPGALATTADHLNNRGQIVGTYSEVSNTRPIDTVRGPTSWLSSASASDSAGHPARHRGLRRSP
jgi:uncharacterized membrane protein